jgi:CMP-N-acetylneuraminic acid synthetase
LKAIAIIPARGGSKGIPRKNIRLLAGKPLIAYTIEAALGSKYVGQVFVSTDDQEIADISMEYGADIVERPAELAQDSSPTINSILHVLDLLKSKNESIDIVVLLQPTSPLRSTEDIDSSIKKFLENEPESLISVCEVAHSPFWHLKLENGYLKPIFEEKYLNMRRQDLLPSYMPNGAIFISTPDNLTKYKGFYCHEIIPYLMPIQRSVDIDNEIDFKMAAILLNNNSSHR